MSQIYECAKIKRCITSDQCYCCLVHQLVYGMIGAAQWFRPWSFCSLGLRADVLLVLSRSTCNWMHSCYTWNLGLQV